MARKQQQQTPQVVFGPVMRPSNPVMKSGHELQKKDPLSEIEYYTGQTQWKEQWLQFEPKIPGVAPAVYKPQKITPPVERTGPITTGQQALAAGTHSQMWRAHGPGGQLGSTALLDSQIILQIRIFEPSLEAYNMVLKRSQAYHLISEADILDLFKQYVYMPLTSSLDAMIDRIVPSDSGRLRNMLKLSYRGGAGSGGGTGAHSNVSSLRPFSMVLNAGGIKYAGPVNNMPDTWLKHFGMSHRGYLSQAISRGQKRGPHALYDPEAETNWFGKVLYYAQLMAIELYDIFVMNHLPRLLEDLIAAYRMMGNMSESSGLLAQGLLLWEAP